MKTDNEIREFCIQQSWYRQFINTCMKDYNKRKNKVTILALCYKYKSSLIASAFPWRTNRVDNISWQEISELYDKWYNEN